MMNLLFRVCHPVGHKGLSFKVTHILGVGPGHHVGSSALEN